MAKAAKAQLPKGGAAKGKGKGKDAGDAAAAKVPSVAAHPRAAASLARLKSWAALIAFSAIALLSFRAGVPPFELAVRALGAGLVAYLAAWAGGVALWRQLVVAELRMEAERRREEREAAEAEAEAEAQAQVVAA